MLFLKLDYKEKKFLLEWHFNRVEDTSIIKNGKDNRITKEKNRIKIIKLLSSEKLKKFLEKFIYEPVRRNKVYKSVISPTLRESNTTRTQLVTYYSKSI